MPRVTPNRRRGLGFFLLVAAAVCLVTVVGLLSTLWMVGVPLAFWRDAAPQKTTYLVRIPINVRPIAAYSKVARADMLDTETGWLKFQELPPESAVGMSAAGVDFSGKPVEGRVSDVHNHEGQVVFVLDSGEEIPQSQTTELGGALMNVSAIIGRVLKKDKSPGLGFRESNFFPRGTPAGLAGATPPGMRSLVIEAGRINGVHSLPQGAQIDLMANVPLDDLSSFDRGSSRLPGAALVLSSASNDRSSKGRTEPIMLAQEAMVLRPVHQRVETTTTATLTQGQRLQAVPVYEVALAVHPSDVIPLQSAINKELEIVCVAHSMQPTGASSGAGAKATHSVAPVTARSVLAYEGLHQDYFLDAATREVRYEPVSPEEIERLGIITSLNVMMGAVVRHDIPKGSFITRDDLLTPPAQLSPAPEDRSAGRELLSPVQLASRRQIAGRFVSDDHAHAEGSSGGRPANVVGRPPSVSRFVPTGHKAVAIPWNRLYGAEYLQIGDRIDLTVSYSLQYEAESVEQERKPDGTVISRTTKRRANEPTQRPHDETLGFRGEPWLAAVNAKVIGPVGYPPPSAATRFLGRSLYEQGSSGQGSPAGPPIVLAIEEQDEETFTAAMATEDAVFSVVLHGDEAQIPPGWKRVVIVPEGIPAYEKLTMRRLQQSHTRRLLTRLVRADDPSFAGALTTAELPDFIGRVVNAYQERQTFLTASDFVMPGVQPGFAANIGPQNSVYVAKDDDIEGLQHFKDNERVAILFRGVSELPEYLLAPGVHRFRPVSSVVVPEARVLRSSQDGETVLEVNRADLARLHAAIAEAFTELPQTPDSTARQHLVAVSLPSGVGATTPSDATQAANRTDIPSYDPLSDAHITEAVYGHRRQVNVFATGRITELKSKILRSGSPK